RRAASRAICTAGKRRATSTPMIAMTPSNSTSVNPPRLDRCDQALSIEGGMRVIMVSLPVGRLLRSYDRQNIRAIIPPRNNPDHCGGLSVVVARGYVGQGRVRAAN